MTASIASHRVMAVRYARHVGRRRDYFHGRAGEPWTEAVSLGYYFWVVEGPQGTILVDTGFTADVAARRGRGGYERSPADCLLQLGIDPSAITTVIITHLHYDHAGCMDLFTGARFILQESEFQFWTGRYANRRELAKHVERQDIERIVGLSLDGRVEFVDGTAQIVPGVTVHRVGGHTPGMQIVEISAGDGVVVLAGDASHFSEHIGCDTPAAVFTDLPSMFGAFDFMNRLVDGDQKRIIPGHSPTLIQELEPVPGIDGWAGYITSAIRSSPQAN